MCIRDSLSMIGAEGDLRVFWSNWLVGSIMTLGMILLFWPALTWLMEKRKSDARPLAAASAGAAAVDPKN